MWFYSLYCDRGSFTLEFQHKYINNHCSLSFLQKYARHVSATISVFYLIGYTVLFQIMSKDDFLISDWTDKHSVFFSSYECDLVHFHGGYMVIILNQFYSYIYNMHNMKTHVMKYDIYDDMKYDGRWNKLRLGLRINSNNIRFSFIQIVFVLY